MQTLKISKEKKLLPFAHDMTQIFVVTHILLLFPMKTCGVRPTSMRCLFFSLSNHLFLCAIAKKGRKKFSGSTRMFGCLISWVIRKYTEEKRRDNLKGGWIYWLYIAAYPFDFFKVFACQQHKTRSKSQFHFNFLIMLHTYAYRHLSMTSI